MQLLPSSFSDIAVKRLTQAQLSECLSSDAELREITARIYDVTEEGDLMSAAELEASRRFRLGQVAYSLDFIPSEEVLRGRAIHQLVTIHSPKLTKAQRRSRRRSLMAPSTYVQKFLIKRKMMELGIAKMKEMYSDAGEAGYDNPQFATRTGRRRTQRRVRGRLQGTGRQPQRTRRTRLVPA